MAFRTEYFRTLPGTLKVFELIFSFIGLLMVILFNSSTKYYYDVPRTYTIVSGIALGVTLFLTIVYIVGLQDHLRAILQYQPYFHLVWMMFVISYASIMVYNSMSYFQLITGGVSGILLAIAFLVDGITGLKSEPLLPK